jgi:hypothetical protein
VKAACWYLRTPKTKHKSIVSGPPLQLLCSHLSINRRATCRLSQRPRAMPVPLYTGANGQGQPAHQTSQTPPRYHTANDQLSREVPIVSALSLDFLPRQFYKHL